MGIVIFLLVLALVVLIHEFGHYAACRAFGIPVTKFAVGFGKPLVSRTDKLGTEWSLRPLPLGGFVMPESNAMANASPFRKFVVAIAGPFANLAPFGALSALKGGFTAYIVALWDLYVAGLLAVFHTLTFGYFYHEAAHSGVVTTTTGGLGGPVGIGAAAVQMNHEGGPLLTFILLFIMLNLGLGLINLLPIPLFDGGKAVFAGVEAVAGRSKARRIERVANYFGIAIILALFVIVTTHDISSLF